MKNLKYFFISALLLFSITNLFSQDIGIELDRNEGIIDGVFIKKDNIVFDFTAFKNQVEIKDKRFTEVLNLNDMSYKSEYEGKKYEDKCEYFPIPKEVDIQS